MANKTLEESKIVQELAPWNKNENSIWLASTLELRRNVEKFKFPEKLEPERKNHLLALLAKEFEACELLHGVQVFREETLTPLEKNFLFEHFLILENVASEHQENRAFIIDDSTSFVGLLHFKNHIQCMMLDVHGDVEHAWGRLQAIEHSLEKAFNFAFSKRFGYLTADFRSCGTGLVVTAFLHVPALVHTHALKECLQNEKNDAILTSGMQGDPEDLVGDILTVRNRYTLGVNEENIIGSVRNSVLHIMLQEKNARGNLQGTDQESIKDKISRALGVLKYTYRLEAKEALNQLSLLKLGIELGMIKGMTIQEVNNLFFTCRQAHLAYLSNTALTSDHIASFRAEHLRSKVGSVTFTG